MNIIIQGSNNFTVSERLRDYVTKRMEKLTYFKNHINEVSFHIDEEKHNFKISVTLTLKKLGTYKFETIDRELHDAIDKIVHKMDTKINREKGKVQNHHSKAGHEELIEFYYEHEQGLHEPTTKIEVNTKPTSLSESYENIKKDNCDFLGFYQVESDKKESISFLRKINDDLLYLLKKKSDTKYGEFSLKKSNNSVIIEKELREINISKMSLLDAQKDILDQDYYFDIFIDSSNNKISLLYKEGNGRWILMA